MTEAAKERSEAQEARQDEKETGRVEAFSDGVFAIAITLLVLELKPPHGAEGPLLPFLAHEWPAYVAFLVSFGSIGIMWVNHHRLFTIIRKVDHGLLLLNLLLLLGITIVPFPTTILAERYQGEDGHWAAILYTLNGLNIAVCYTLLWRHASRDGRLLTEDADRELVARINKQYRFGPLLYLVGVALAFVSVSLSVGLAALLALFFALPPPPLRKPRRVHP
jgi:uncharacterized membrane protein